MRNERHRLDKENAGSVQNAMISIPQTTFAAFSELLQVNLNQFEIAIAALASQVDSTWIAIGNQMTTVETRFQTEMDELQNDIDDAKALISALTVDFDTFTGELTKALREMCESIPAPPTLDQVTRQMALVVAKTNLPIRWVSQPAVQEAAAVLTPTMSLPSARSVRQTIISIADESRANFSLSEVVQELKEKDITVVAVVTDNAENEKAAIRGLSEILRWPVFRIPCLSHTLNLALGGALAALFPGRDFYAEMMLLYKAIHSTTEGEDFFGVHGPCATRWCSLGIFIKRVATDFPRVFAAVMRRDAAARHIPLIILLTYNFAGLSNCFTAIDQLIEWTEGRDASVAKA
jgi:hypothetical protein